MTKLTPADPAAERWIECGSGCRNGHTNRWPSCQRATDPVTLLPSTERAVAEAIREYQRIPDGGDGYPSIRMGTPWELAEVAVAAARSEIYQEVQRRLVRCVHPSACAAIDEMLTEMEETDD